MQSLSLLEDASRASISRPSAPQYSRQPVAICREPSRIAEHDKSFSWIPSNFCMSLKHMLMLFSGGSTSVDTSFPVPSTEYRSTFGFS